MLTEDTITFGKYSGGTLRMLLRDRKYCQWLMQSEQESWFKTKYEYLYNRVQEYQPQSIFIRGSRLEEQSATSAVEFCARYEYFQLPEPSESIHSKLDRESDYIAYKFYYTIVMSFKEQILKNVDDQKPQPYDIKAPNKWLIKFEQENNLSRDVFKEFIEAYDLLNIPSIIERIKKEGNIEYNGAKSFIIAKQNSVKQEAFWEAELKKIFHEDLGVQFKFENCIFDFININSNTIYECKLSLNDFNQKQFNKYERTLEKFKMVYLIGYDTIINFDTKKIYSTLGFVNLSTPSISEEFKKILLSFEFCFVADRENLMKKLN